MNRAGLFLLGSLMLLFDCSVANGQGCDVTLEPHFSVYNSVSRDGKTIYTSVTMQGYANICGPCGCPQMNTATHRAAAENKLNNVDHWSYSGSSCPTCYFSITDNEQMSGDPGVLYPWTCGGEAICSIVGNFWGGDGGCSSIPGCVVPSTETTAVAGTINSTLTQFNQAISDTAGDDFDGTQIDEGDATTAQDTCWWGPTSGVPKTTGVTGGPPWTVAGDDVPGQHNHWGFDTVGWTPSAVTYYRAQAPGHGIAIPCGFTVYQSLQIKCSTGVWWTYTPSFGNKLTGTIEQTDVVNCRYDMNNTACQTINY
jgi:hypothetical protein